MTMRRWFLITSIATVMALAVTAWVAADESGHRTPRNAGQVNATPPEWEQLVSKGRREAQAVELDRWPFAEVKKGPVMPRALREEAKEMLRESEQLDLRFEDVRFAEAPNRMDIWVVPGDRIICMFRAVRMAGACSTTTQAYRHGMVLQTYRHRNGRPTSFEALGIVPDGIVKVPAKIGRRWTKLNVVANTFFVESQKPIGIRWPG